MKCTFCGSELTDCMPYCETCGQPIPKDQLAQQTPRKSFPHTGLYSLKWFHFLIYFSLFASAVINTITAIVTLSGNRYAGLYIDLSELANIEKIFGVLSLVLAGLAILTRFRLSGFYRNGPALLIALYAFALVLDIAYTICAKSVMPYYAASQISIITPNFIASVAMLIANIIYFNKRKDLFVN